MGKVKGLDMAKLRNMQSELDDRSTGGGGGDIFQASKIKGSVFVRLLPPDDAMDHVYFIERHSWWIDGKPYQSNSTPVLGGRDVIKEVMDDAKAAAKKDKTLSARINQKGEHGPLVQKKTSYYLRLFIIENEEFDKQGQIEAFDVQGEKAVIFECGAQMMAAINKIVTSPMYQNGTDFGIMDRKKGHFLELSKTGKQLGTKYTAIAFPQPFDTSGEDYDDLYDTDVEGYKGPMELVTAFSKSDSYLESVIRNYLYGDDIEGEESSKGEEDAPKRRRKPAKVEEDEHEERPARRSNKVEVEDDDDDEPPVRRSRKPVVEEEELDENWEPEEDEPEEDDESPARPARRSAPAAKAEARPARRKAAAVEPEEDEPEDEPAPTARSSRRTRGGKSLMDDL